MNCKQEMERWLKENPNATVEEAFEAGWMICTDAWCHGKREQMDACIVLMNDIIR